MQNKPRIFKPAHERPTRMYYSYILLPYGLYYDKTRVFLDAKPGDILRFYNGPEVRIERVMLIPCDSVCNTLCLMRYGITWDRALKRLTTYARMEGHSPDVLSKEECIMVVYKDAEDTE